MTELGQYCPELTDITSEVECRAAAMEKKLIYGNIYNGPGNHKFCQFAEDGRSKVFFNEAGTPSPHPWSNYASLCHKEIPAHLFRKCTRFSPEMTVSDAGTWAIAIFFLAGLWCVALRLVFVMFAPNMKVHPEVHHVTVDPHGLATFRQQAENTRLKRCQKICKKCVKFVLMSVETMVGTAVFVVSAIAIIVTGGVQLPKEKPECAIEPESAMNLGAWIAEPVRRYEIVWCEYGPLAAVGLSFLGFCCFLLGFSMSLRRAVYFYHEERKRVFKLKLRQQKQKAKETGEAVEEGPDLGEGFRVGKMCAQDALPDCMFEDYDGKVFDC